MTEAGGEGHWLQGMNGVRVTAINPGSIRTSRLTTRIRQLTNEKGVTEEEAARQRTARMGVERFGEPTEAADAVAFLASDRAAYHRSHRSSRTYGTYAKPYWLKTNSFVLRSAQRMFS
jgi:NAD(P)-dependent dehydrogenase (short-subunit alcohol dehydrogenase family)